MKSRLGMCPSCGGELEDKSVEKILKGGNDTASITVGAQVCLRCGEKLFNQDTVRNFEEIRAKLESGETSEFEPVGQSYSVETR